MSKAPKKVFISVHPDYGPWECYSHSDGNSGDPYPEYQYIRADIVDELVEALKFAWPIIEHERYKWEGSYGKNFDSAKADRARQACEKAKAALAKLEESHD